MTSSNMMIFCLLFLCGSLPFTTARFDEELITDGIHNSRLGKAVDAMGKIGNYAGQIAGFLGNDTSMISGKLGTYFGAIAPALGYIGPAFALITAVDVAMNGSPDSSEAKLMRQEFGKLNQRFDVVDDKLDDIDNAVERITHSQDYRQAHTALANLKAKFEQATANEGAYFAEQFKSACERDDPSTIMQSIHTMITVDLATDGKPFLEAFRDDYNWNYVKFQQLMQMILSDMTALSVYTMSCAEVVTPDLMTDSVRQVLGQESTDLMQEVAEQFESAMLEIENDFGSAAERDLIAEASKQMGSLKSYHQQVQTQRLSGALKTFLDEKYPFAMFTVFTTRHGSEYKSVQCLQCRKMSDVEGHDIEFYWEYNRNGEARKANFDWPQHYWFYVKKTGLFKLQRKNSRRSLNDILNYHKQSSRSNDFSGVIVYHDYGSCSGNRYVNVEKASPPVSGMPITYCLIPKAANA